jgi:hypothetical protein
VRLGGHQLRSTTEAVAQSHQWFAGNLAHTVGDSVNESVGDLTTAVKLYAVKPARSPEETIAFFAKNSPHSRGLAVVDRSSGRLLASVGEPVAVESLRPNDSTGVSVRVVVDRQGGAQTVIADVLPGGDRLVVMSTDLVVPPSTVDSRLLPETVLLGTTSGEVIRPRAADEHEAGDLVRQAAAAAAGGATGHLVGAEGTGPPMADGRPTAPLVAYAPVTTGDAQTRLGISLILLGATPTVPDTGGEGGLLPALSLLGVGLLVLLLLGGAVVRPVRRLRADALAIASGTLHRPVRQYRGQEARRIAAALEACRRQLIGVPDRLPPPAPGRWSARSAVVLAVVAVLAWSGTVLLTVGRGEVQVPEQSVQVTQNLAKNTADSLRRSLAQSLTDLQTFAGLVSETAPDALRPALEELTSRHTRYRSVYVVDTDGAIQVSAGRSPLRSVQRPPETHGLHQQNTDGRIPVIFASSPLADGRHVLIGELDVTKLSALVRKSGGSGRLVDAGLRTLAAADGYRAFEELTEDPLRRSVQDALHGVAQPAVREVDGAQSVVASAAIYGSSITNELQWAVVIEQPVSRLPLLGNEIRRSAWLAALLGTVIALLALGWHLLALVLPLRRVAASAQRLLDGDTATVIYPQRPDEVGTIARCLELCRQGVAEGPHRLGPATTKGPLCVSSTSST